MGWEYMVEEFAATARKETIEKDLGDFGDGGWEAVTSWAVPGDPHVNNGEWRVFILFKKQKPDS